eukprot:1158316-Pelagomonas_calceolata.AAC.2
MATKRMLIIAPHGSSKGASKKGTQKMARVYYDMAVHHGNGILQNMLFLRCTGVQHYLEFAHLLLYTIAWLRVIEKEYNNRTKLCITSVPYIYSSRLLPCLTNALVHLKTKNADRSSLPE